MNENDIKEIAIDYYKNPNLINDKQFFKKLINTFNTYLNDTEGYNVLYNFSCFNSEIINNLFGNDKILNYILEDKNNNFFDFYCEFYSGILAKSDFIFKIDIEKLANYLNEYDLPYSLQKEYEFFKYIENKNKNLLAKFDLSYIFHEVCDELLNNYGNHVLEFIKNKYVPYRWRANQKLFEYVEEHDKTLISKFNLLEVFPEVTDEILAKYGNYILKLFKSQIVPYKWKTSKKIFEYAEKHDKTLVSYFDLSDIFPEITDDVLKKHGDSILIYIKDFNIIPYNWNNNSYLYIYFLENDDYLYKKNRSNDNFDFKTIAKILYDRKRPDLLIKLPIEILSEKININTTYLDYIADCIKNKTLEVDFVYSRNIEKYIAYFYMTLAKHNVLNHFIILTEVNLLEKNNNKTLLEQLLDIDSDFTFNNILTERLKSNVDIAIILKKYGFNLKKINIVTDKKDFTKEYINNFQNSLGMGPLLEEGENLLKELKELFTLDGKK